jgi:hypothetical protein
MHVPHLSYALDGTCNSLPASFSSGNNQEMYASAVDVVTLQADFSSCQPFFPERKAEDDARVVLESRRLDNQVMTSSSEGALILCCTDVVVDSSERPIHCARYAVHADEAFSVA